MHRSGFIVIRCLLSVAMVTAVGLTPLLAAEHAHEAPVANTRTTITLGGELKSAEFGREALAKLPRHTVRATAHGVSANYEGVDLIDVLSQAGAPTGDKLRGKALSLYVRVIAADGYQVPFALAELEPAFRGNKVLLVDRRDGVAIDGIDGPFRLVAPDEKRPGRWIRQVVSIDLIRAP